MKHRPNVLRPLLHWVLDMYVGLCIVGDMRGLTSQHSTTGSEWNAYPACASTSTAFGCSAGIVGFKDRNAGKLWRDE